MGAPHFYIPVHFINSFFLFVTGLVYILLWEKQNIHGWTVLSFVLAMFFMFIFLAWSHLAAMLHKSNANPHFAPPPLVCRCVGKENKNGHVFHYGNLILMNLIGALAHFFFLATFCWLAIINVDLWLTFKFVFTLFMYPEWVECVCYFFFLVKIHDSSVGKVERSEAIHLLHVIRLGDARHHCGGWSGLDTCLPVSLVCMRYPLKNGSSSS